MWRWVLKSAGGVEENIWLRMRATRLAAVACMGIEACCCACCVLQGAPNSFDLSAASTSWGGRRLKTRLPTLICKVGAGGGGFLAPPRGSTQHSSADLLGVHCRQQQGAACSC